MEWNVVTARVTDHMTADQRCWFPPPQVALSRVSSRVKQGGHSVSRADVLRRFKRGWTAFLRDLGMPRILRPVVEAALIPDRVIPRRQQPGRVDTAKGDRDVDYGADDHAHHMAMFVSNMVITSFAIIHR